MKSTKKPRGFDPSAKHFFRRRPSESLDTRVRLGFVFAGGVGIVGVAAVVVVVGVVVVGVVGVVVGVAVGVD